MPGGQDYPRARAFIERVGGILRSETLIKSENSGLKKLSLSWIAHIFRRESPPKIPISDAPVVQPLSEPGDERHKDVTREFALRLTAQPDDCRRRDDREIGIRCFSSHRRLYALRRPTLSTLSSIGQTFTSALGSVGDAGKQPLAAVFPIWEVWSSVFNFDQFFRSCTSTIAATCFRFLPPQNPESRLGVLFSVQPTDGEARLLHLHCEERLAL